MFLKKGKKHKPSEICQLTDVPERTQMDWVFAAKASGDWDLISLKSAPKKRRSDAGVGRKLSWRMIATIKTGFLTTPDWLWIRFVRRFLVSLWSAGRGSAVQLSTRLLFQHVWPRRSLCSFQFNKLHHFDCLCSSINYSAKYCPFLKKSGSFEILLLCTTKFWYYFLKLTKFKSFYEGFTFSASYRGRTCIIKWVRNFPKHSTS